MSGFLRYFRAERIKWRRDWTLLTAILAPSAQVIFLFLIMWFSEDRATLLGSGFPAWYRVNFLVWNLVVMPVVVALISALAWEVEDKANAWNHIFAQPESKALHYLVKLASQFALVLMAEIMLVLLLVVGGLLLKINVPALHMDSANLPLLGHYAWFSLVAFIPVLSLQAWLPVRFPGLGVSLALAIGGSWLSFQLANRWPFNGMIPWGVASQIADIALRAKLPPPSIYFVSGVCTIGIIFLGMIDFRRRIETMNRRS